MQNLLEEFRAQGVPDGEMEGLLSDLQWLEMLGEWKAMRWQGGKRLSDLKKDTTGVPIG